MKCLFDFLAKTLAVLAALILVNSTAWAQEKIENPSWEVCDQAKANLGDEVYPDDSKEGRWLIGYKQGKIFGFDCPDIEFDPSPRVPEKTPQEMLTALTAPQTDCERQYAQLSKEKADNRLTYEEVDWLRHTEQAVRLSRICPTFDHVHGYPRSSLHPKGRPTPDNLGIQLLDRKCRTGYHKGCKLAATAYRNGYGVEPDRIYSAALSTIACREAQDLGSCYWATAVTAERAARGIGSEAQAMDGFQRLCDMGQDRVCSMLEYNYPETLVEKADKLLSLGCDANLPSLCEESYLSNIRNDDTFSMGRVHMRFSAAKLCELGQTEMCHNAGALFVEIRDDGDSARKALALFGQGCEGGFQPSCEAMPYAEMRVSEEWRQSEMLRQSSREGGIAGFLSDLGKGIDQAYSSGARAPGSETAGVESRPQTPDSAYAAYTEMRRARSQQDQRDFDNAVNAINNTGSAFNSNCPASNPYC